MTKEKKSIFAAFENLAEGSEGLEGLESTKMRQEMEKRDKKISVVVTTKEFSEIRDFARQLEAQWGRRVTVSDICRELALVFLGEESGNPHLKEEIMKRMRGKI